MSIFIIFLIAIVIALWLSTIHFYQPEEGQLSVIKRFKTHITIVGVGIPDIPIPKEIFDVPGVDPKIKIDSSKSFYFLIWPYSIGLFDYRYKKFRTLKEIRTTNGEVRWQPLIPKDKTGIATKTTNDPDTIALGEWKEIKKSSLFAREREDIAIPFLTRDGYRGTAFGYLKYIVYNYSAAISTTYQAKSDPEKSVLDKFQKWTRTADYLTAVYGVSFEELPDAGNFYRTVNKDNYLTGVILEDIEFTEFVLDPESQDLLEAQEKIKKATIAFEEAKILADTTEKQGDGERRKKMKIADGEAYAIDKTGTATNLIQTALDKSLKTNEVDQFKSKKEIERENDVKEFSSKTEITLDANKQILDKAMELKKVPDATLQAKYDSLAKITNLSTLILHGDENVGGSDKLDEILEANIIAKQIVHPKTK